VREVREKKVTIILDRTANNGKTYAIHSCLQFRRYIILCTLCETKPRKICLCTAVLHSYNIQFFHVMRYGRNRWYYFEIILLIRPSTQRIDCACSGCEFVTNNFFRFEWRIDHNNENVNSFLTHPKQFKV